MAYDVHIVRTDDWLNAEDDPVTKDEVDALIASDPELSWSTEDYVDMRSGPRTKVVRYFMIRWKGDPCFLWCRHEITCAGPNEAQLGKLVAMAAKLGVNVFGDDGEAYREPAWRAVFRRELPK